MVGFFAGVIESGATSRALGRIAVGCVYCGFDQTE